MKQNTVRKITSLKPNEAIHCPTRQVAYEICRIMDEAGLKTDAGRNYLNPETKHWSEINDSGICYYPATGFFSTLKYATVEGYKIFPASDFISPNAILKSRKIPNITEFTATECIRCITYSEAKEICKLMHEAGLRWFSGDSYSEYTYWSDGSIYYFPHSGTFSRYSTHADVTVYQAIDFLPENFNVTKDDSLLLEKESAESETSLVPKVGQRWKYRSESNSFFTKGRSYKITKVDLNAQCGYTFDDRKASSEHTLTFKYLNEHFSLVDNIKTKFGSDTDLVTKDEHAVSKINKNSDRHFSFSEILIPVPDVPDFYINMVPESDQIPISIQYNTTLYKPVIDHTTGIIKLIKIF